MVGREPGFLFDIGSMPNTVEVLTYHLIAAGYYLLRTAASSV